MAKKKKDKEKDKGGAPTKYLEAYNKQAYKLTLLGYTDEELASFFNVDKQTIYNWKDKYTEFFDSIREGKELADANIAESLYKKGKGFTYKERVIVFKKPKEEIEGEELLEISTEELIKRAKELGIEEIRITEKESLPDTNAAIRWLSNRQRKKWRLNPDNQEDERSQHQGPININFTMPKGFTPLPDNEDQIKTIPLDDSDT